MTNETAGDLPEPDELLRVWREPGVAGQGVVVHAAGEIDLDSASAFQDGLDGLEAVTGPAVVDLTEVTFLGSAGLSLLVQHHLRCREAGVRMRVVTGNRFVARTIALTGLADTLALYDTLDEAVAIAS
jgi:anti-anti-sigma factor